MLCPLWAAARMAAARYEAAPGFGALRELSGSVAAGGVSQMVSVPHTDREVHDGSKGYR
jgi:predicted phage tail protein